MDLDLFEYARQNAQEDPETPEERSEAAIFTVGELTSEIKALLTTTFGRECLWVKGEISNYRGRNPNGHMYFSLKDERAVLNCVVFRNANKAMAFEMKDGLQVLAFGRIDLWEKGGKYQLVIEQIRPGGTGELYLRFEQLKKKLEGEGLFALERKRPLPKYPERIGLVTSPSGAAIRDVITVIRRRFPYVSLVLAPVRVQGEGSAGEIAEAIRRLNDPKHALDLLLLVRGGGSIEDLWAFNEEVLARAVVGSRVPVITGVGHETDFTIADFVSDRRAATPSQAAEIAVPNVRETKRHVQSLLAQIAQTLVQARRVASQKLEGLNRSAPLRDPRSMIRARMQRLDLAVERVVGLVRSRRERNHARFDRAVNGLNLLNPLAILARGYSVVNKADGSILKSARDTRAGERVNVRLHEGGLTCEVKAISKPS